MLRTILSRSQLLRFYRTAQQTRHASPPALIIGLSRALSTSRPRRYGLPNPPRDGSGNPPLGSDTPSPSERTTYSDEPIPLQPPPPPRSQPLPPLSQLPLSSSSPPSPALSSANTRNSPETESDIDTHDSTGKKASQLTTAIDVDEVKEKLRSWSENASVALRDRADRYTALAATTFAQLGKELNKVTGYGEIESLKKQVADQGTSR